MWRCGFRVGRQPVVFDRVEKSIAEVDIRYRDLAERLAKVEESLKDSEKRTDELCAQIGKEVRDQ